MTKQAPRRGKPLQFSRCGESTFKMFEQLSSQRLEERTEPEFLKTGLNSEQNHLEMESAGSRGPKLD